jgi:hypothetical protein
MMPSGLSEEMRSRLLRPGIVAGPAIYLASDDSSHLSGHRLVGTDWTPESPEGYLAADGLGTWKKGSLYFPALLMWGRFDNNLSGRWETGNPRNTHLCRPTNAAIVTPGPQLGPEFPKRPYGSAILDPDRVGRDAGRIAEEVLTHLAALPGSRLRVSVEIEAVMPEDAPVHVQRTVSENARALKFEMQGFEPE